MIQLGMPLEQYRAEHGEVTLAQAVEAAAEKVRGAQKAQFEFGELFVREGVLQTEEEQLAAMDDAAWGMMAKVLDIPSPYLNRLGVRMKEANVNYWLGLYEDKVATLVFRDMELLEFIDGTRIEPSDVLKILLDLIPDGVIMRSFQQTNATVIDVIDDARRWECPHAEFVSGVRAVVKEGLNAPEIYPLFVDVRTSGAVEFADRFDKLNIKSLAYGDILHVIAERVADCLNCADGLFSTYRQIEGEYIVKPRRRVQHLCQEHHIPNRVEAYALREFDDAGLSTANFGNIIALFSTLGFVDEVKQSSERKLQQLAGHIVTRSQGECRCSACDALELAEVE